MIIKDNKQKSKFSVRKTGYLLLALVCLGIVVRTLGKRSESRHDKVIAFCDAEQVSGDHFKGRPGKFRNAQTRSGEKSFSGRYSSKLTKDHAYGMAYTIKNPEKGVTYVAEVRRYSKNNSGALAIKSNDGSTLYAQTVKSAGHRKGWDSLHVELFVPWDSKVKELLIFPVLYNPSDTVFFDDLKIYKKGKRPSPVDLAVSKLHLYLDDKALKKINAVRRKALKKGILLSRDNQWVTGKLTIDDQEDVEVKLRLKGDWTDHLKGKYWSYRIKMPPEKSWNRLMTFSLQDPERRGFLNEWVYHQWLEREDVLTPRYDFVVFRQNAQPAVCYSYEEHFDKQLVESRRRREGVILKFAEDAMWEIRARNPGDPKAEDAAVSLNASEIRTFKEKKTLKSPKLREQYHHARDLLLGFKQQNLPLTDVFDVERLAKYYAITDIMDANHSFIWHNQRFYYNPLTKLLEPIGYDGFSGKEPYRLYWHVFFGEYKSSPARIQWSKYYKYPFQDSTFNAYYLPLLVKYTSPEYIEEMMKKLSPAIHRREALLRQYQYPEYKYDSTQIVNRAARIRKNILPYNEHSIKAYRDQGTVWVTNDHTVPLLVVGSGRKRPKKKTEANPVRLILSNGYDGLPQFTALKIPENHRYVYFQLPGLDKIYYSRIKNYPPPKVAAPPDLRLQIPLPKERYIEQPDEITILAGTYRLDKPLVIPKGKNLTIEPGTEIDLVKGAYILSYGRVFLRGLEEVPIRITSSDKSSQGFVVIQAPGKSQIYYTYFEQLKNLTENNWQMSGAVTLYESPVEMSHVIVAGNGCEDALNIVRSTMEVKKLFIHDTYADGFDCDFCKGTVLDSRFENTGNDALDFSGSRINVKNVTMKNIGDKGLSAGEESKVTAEDIFIEKAVIGVASKDLSEVYLKNIRLKDCEIGFAAYRKKPEFGGGKIKLESYDAVNVKKLHSHDEESKIIMPDDEAL